MTIMMKRFSTLVGLLGILGILYGPAPVLAQQPPDEPQREFGELVPFEELPPEERLPAAPLLVAAYAFAWLAVFFYLWTVWRRLSRVEAEMRTLEQRQTQRGNDASPVNSVNSVNRTSTR